MNRWVWGALPAVVLYTFAVLSWHWHYDHPWGQSLLVSLVLAPVGALASLARVRMIRDAQDRGRRMRWGRSRS